VASFRIVKKFSFTTLRSVEMPATERMMHRQAFRSYPLTGSVSVPI